MRKFFVLALMFSVASVSAQINWNASQITITTEAQLRELASRVNNGNSFAGQTLTLGGHINLNGSAQNQWIPIGSAEELCYSDDWCQIMISNAFSGIFDGANHTISGLYINSDNLLGVGLFGAIEGGTVKNLNLAGVNIVGFGDMIGGLAGLLSAKGLYYEDPDMDFVSDNPGKIINCSVTGRIEANGYHIGGLTGMSAFSTVENSRVDINFEGYGSYVGGLAGYVFGGVIRNSYAAGSVSDGSRHIGGLVGELVLGTVENCRANVNVSGNTGVGGLAGVLDEGIIKNSHAAGTVSGREDVGGLAGSSSYGEIINSYALATLQSGDYEYVSFSSFGALVGRNDGIVRQSFALEGTADNFIGEGEGTVVNSSFKTEAQLRLNSTFGDWDFTAVWGISADRNYGFPFLLALSDAYIHLSVLRDFVSGGRRNASTASFAGIRGGQISLNLSAGNYTAELYNMQGRLISSVNISAINGINATGLRTDSLARGIFILNVKQSGVPVLKQRIGITR